MNDYSYLVGVSNNGIMSSLIWGTLYFLLLFAPMYVYMRSFFNRDNNNRVEPIFELVAQAIFLQLAFLIVVVGLGLFLTGIDIGSSDLKPEVAFKIFFGDGSSLIDTRWKSYIEQMANDSSFQAKLGNEFKGTSFLAIYYIGLIYRLFLILGFFVMFYTMIVFATRTFDNDALKNGNALEKLFQIFVSVVGLVFFIHLHSMIASQLPAMFGIPSDAVAINFISYFQEVTKETFWVKVLFK